tara:strand:- start:4067 stop:4555 length:489 start_codon:yes stop_codon:yes gene_type:complete
MCQNRNIQNVNKVKGSILLTCNKVPVFMPEVFLKENDNCVLTNWISLADYQLFGYYLKQLNLFSEKGHSVICDFATLKAVYNEFIEMEQNKVITALLWQNNIFPKVPEVKALQEIKALNTSSVNGRFNIWLNKARRLLQHATGAGFFNLKKARRYHTASQDK